jgi:hypothetical protein
MPRELADLEQVQAERLHLSQHAKQCRLIDETSQFGVVAVLPRHHRRERGQCCGTEVTLDPDRIQGSGRIHRAMVEGWHVKPHRQDQVIRWG